MNNMTVTTRAMYTAATSRTMTVQEAVMLLRQEMKPRTLPDKLARFAKGRDLRTLLAEGLKANHPDKKPDSMDRKVRDWLGGKDRAIRKEDAVELCFILSLTVEEADELLMLVCEEGFHWRDPAEIPFIFALKQGIEYPAACALAERMAAVCTAPETEAEDSYTGVIRAEVAALQSEAQLAEYLRGAAARLGKMHNTAYQLFMEYMTLLEEGDIADLLEDATAMSTRDVVEQYFFRRFVPRVKGSEKALSAIQRAVWSNWPDEVSVSRMKSRVIDVTRKVMILLFIATDGGMDDEDEALIDEWEDESVFEDTYTRLNEMLAMCGFAPLDPRAPFDWMMLYCMCVEDVFDMDAQMEAFLGTLFDGEV
ncbi:MAG: hypothetical protein IKK21_12445 [Clostridia bacterium]|nr:hypothetical protein [Clostridia bacterium]